MFRLWQPHEDAYMLAWNATVAEYTSRKLSMETLTPVLYTAGLICIQNQIDPGEQGHWLPSIRILANHFLSLALAAEGILPILDRSPAKWFWLVDPIGASARLSAHSDEVWEHVVRDLWNKHGVKLEPRSV